MTLDIRIKNPKLISLNFNILNPPCDIALTFSPSQVVIASTPLIFYLKSQHVVVESSNGSNLYKVYTFVKNDFISNLLENGPINNPMLIYAFEFVKNISELGQYYLILYVL